MGFQLFGLALRNVKSLVSPSQMPGGTVKSAATESLGLPSIARDPPPAIENRIGDPGRISGEEKG